MADKPKNNRELLGTQNVHTLIPKMAVPTIVAQMITTVYNLVDTFFVSKLGTEATAAVGVNNSLERCIILVGTLLGAGACSYIARLLGSKRDKEADQVLSTSLFTGFAIGVVLAVLGKIFLSPLTDFLGATAECKQYAMEYGTYVLFAAPFMITSFILNMTLRSEGSAMFSMIGIGFGSVLNCFLDPLFIFTFDLGVAGASMATAISKTISCIILAWPYFRKKTVTKLALANIRYKAEHIKEVIGIGMASFMRSIFGVIANIMLNRVAGGYSTAMLAAISVSTRVMMFPFSALLGFGQGFQPVCGYNWGAKKYDRVKESYSFSLKIALIGGVVIGGVIIALAHPFIGLFNSKGDPEIFRYGCIAIRAEAAVLFTHSCGVIVNMFFAGIGRSREATLLSTARQGYCFIPLLFVLPKLFGEVGFCLTQMGADILSLLVIVPLAIKAKKIIAKAEQSE